MQGPATDEEDGPIAAINVIPLVDVVLVLLIIFMVTTVFTRDSNMKLDLPEASTPNVQKRAPKEITVLIEKTERILVEGQPVPREKVADKIRSFINPKSTQKTVIVLRGDKTVAYGVIMPVLEEISHTGIDLTLAYKVPSKK